MVDISAVLKDCPLFAGFPAAALREAGQHARVRRFARGEVIYEDGAMQSSLCVIAEGTVRISSVNAEGREATLILFDQGTWFGDAVFSPNTPRVYGATAHTAAVLVELEGEAFRQLMARYPQSYPVILDLLSQRLWSAISLLEEDALRGLASRVGRRLLFLAQMQRSRSGGEQPVRVLLTREHLANMMGVTRQGIHKVLKNYQEAGLISLGYGEIVIPHPQALEAHLDTLV
ncbi:transcriptional regulator Anr [Alcanivorax hongdengensis A-11-3]|uniref:Transcriptional regulator Anr n=1 Tax=Alcanivorax hongdengensis A-11-3 TaxID=1177179 RepID=L0WGT5_9GAMM|nr:Crp/Fnr family transcriptional regulator [Alcanivorax hongdengensis]EKF75035.1 transcriptional regulator Anr [Alcanivorax hongdengensis A-11-3]